MSLYRLYSIKRSSQWLDNVKVGTDVTDWTFFTLPITSYHLVRVATSTLKSTFTQVAHNVELADGITIHTNKVDIVANPQVTSYVLVLCML